MDVAKGEIGQEGAWGLKIEGGKAVLSAKHTHASGEVSVVITEDAKYFLEKLKVIIPGTIDDMIINIAEAALP